MKPPSPVLLKPKQDTDKPYSKTWLDSCYQETLLPGSPWHKINRYLCDEFAQLIARQMSNPRRAAILYQLLGPRFMTEYFPHVSTTSNVIDEMPVEERKKLLLEGSGWLKAQLLKAAKQLSYVQDSPESAVAEVAEVMQEFLAESVRIFLKGMNRELYKIERELVESEKGKLRSDRKLLLDNRIGEFLGYSHLAPVDETISPQKPSAAHRRSAVSSVKTERVRASLFNLNEFPDVPNMASKPIQFVADSIVKILEKSPGNYDTVAKRLHGRMLPSALRRYMWTETLYKAEREKLTRGSNVERILRERFGRAVARSIKELRTTRAIQSPMSRIIENAVIEKYEDVPALAVCRTKETMRDTIKALNVLYTYDRTYESYLILWLFPLQIAYSLPADNKGPEYAYELAMHLDLLNSTLLPSWSQVFAIADRVMEIVKKRDYDLFEHLEIISKRVSKVNRAGVAAELLHQEAEEAAKLLHKATMPNEVSNESILYDPRIYLRKWIGEAFVSVVDTPAVMLIWDQLFLQNWASTVLQDFSLVIIVLLRDQFMSATEHMTMREIFLYEPCKLLLFDIQSVWVRLQEGENYAKISMSIRTKNAVQQSEGLNEAVPVLSPNPADSISVANSLLPDTDRASL